MSGNGTEALPPSNPFPYLTRFRIEYFYLLNSSISAISFSTQYLLSLKTPKHCYPTVFSLTIVRDDALSDWRPTIWSYPKYSVLTFWTLPSKSLLRDGYQNDNNYFRIVLPRYTGNISRQNFSPSSHSRLYKQVLHHSSPLAACSQLLVKRTISALLDSLLPPEHFFFLGKFIYLF